MLNIPFRTVACTGILAATGIFVFSFFGLAHATTEISTSGKVDTLLKGTAHEAFFALDFKGKRGIAVGAGGAIYDSSDGGKTWEREKHTETQLALLDVSIGEQQTIIVGQYGVILRSESADKWESIDSGTELRLLAVAQNTDGLAFAVGQFGTIIRSNDGGKSWKSVAPEWFEYSEEGHDPQLYDVTISDSGIVTLVGEFGLIIRSYDQGENWSRVNGGGATESSLFAISFDSSKLVDNPDEVAAIAADSPPPTEEEAVEEDLGSLVATTVINLRAKATTESDVVGKLQTGEVVALLENPEGDWARIEHESGEAWVYKPLTEISDESVDTVAVAESDDTADKAEEAGPVSTVIGYAVGQAGSVLKTTDGGQTWSNVDTGTEAILLSVYQGDSGKVMIIGVREMLESDDNGATWKSIHSGDIQISWYQDIGSAGSGSPLLAVGHTGKIIQVVH